MGLSSPLDSYLPALLLTFSGYPVGKEPAPTYTQAASPPRVFKMCPFVCSQTFPLPLRYQSRSGLAGNSQTVKRAKEAESRHPVVQSQSIPSLNAVCAHTLTQDTHIKHTHTHRRVSAVTITCSLSKPVWVLDKTYPSPPFQPFVQLWELGYNQGPLVLLFQNIQTQDRRHI